MKEFNEALERQHPEDDTLVRSAMLLVAGRGWVVQYDVGADLEPWLMYVVAGAVKWAHPVDYDVTQLARLQPKSEPRPIIRWDRTGNVWHTDVGKVGRYSVRRMSKGKPWAAYLNGDRIMSESVHSNPEIVKRAIETRIERAFDINKNTDAPFQSPLGSRRVNPDR